MMRAALLLLLIALLSSSAATAGPAWSFDRNGDAEGWTANDATGQHSVSDGAWTFKITGNDPNLLSPPFQVPAQEARVVHLRLETALKKGEAQVFFRTGERPFAEARSVSFQLQPESEGPVDYYVDLAHSANFQGVLTQMRLDPDSRAPGGWMRIHEIRLLPHSEAPEGAIDQRILGAGENVDPGGAAAPVASWRFDTSEGAADWSVVGDGDIAAPANDAIRVVFHGADSAIEARGLDLDADRYPILHIRAVAEGFGGAMVIEWGRGGELLGTAPFFSPANTSVYDDAFVDLGAHPAWRGEIQWVRLSPDTATPPGGSLSIDLIQFLERPSAS